MMNKNNVPTRRILRLPEVINLTGFSKSWIYQLMGLGKFPNCIKIGIRSVGWDSYEITAWINKMIEEKRY
ncbi:AlpA family phage regulatory protein [Halopseudomonas pelagia]|uniref:AlpA family phage regulatory protein n=2 Tax=Halopseudomonas pelagia TaxID=553151 RepID=A0AA91U558_9GAMM|nr:AlpA family transcriptional regulator [Halopseudomonas pelagia]QFY58726.1 AlpA family phage regulatory protein [Halopseudomonas pelagia]